MENQNLNSQLPPANSSAARKAKIMYSGLAFLFILSLSSSAFGLYAWNREKKNVTRLNSQVSSLQSRSTTDAVHDAPASQPSQSSVSPAAKSSTVYKAEAGKFTLSLPSSLVVIERRDGGGGGGLSTSLLIGKKTSQAGVIESSDYGRIEVDSNSSLSRDYGSLKQWINKKLEQIGGGAEKQAPTMVDGMSAETYIITGLYSSKYLFFAKGDTYYTITAINNDAAGVNETLETVAKSFKFN